MSHSARSSRSYNPVDEIGVYPIRRSSASLRVASLSDKSAPTSRPVQEVAEISVHPVRTSPSRLVEVGRLSDKASSGSSRPVEEAHLSDKASSGSSRPVDEAHLSDKASSGSSRQAEVGRLSDKTSSGSSRQAEVGRLSAKASSGSSRQAEVGRLSDKASSGSSRQAEVGRLSDKVSSGSSRQAEVGRLSDKASSGSSRSAEEARLSDKASSGSSRSTEEARLSDKASSGSSRSTEEARLSDKAPSGSSRSAEEARLSDKASSSSSRLVEEARLSDKASSGSSRQAEVGRLSDKASSGSSRQAEEARLSDKASSGSSRPAEDARLSDKASSGSSRAAEDVRLSDKASSGSSRAVEAARLSDKASSGSSRPVEEVKTPEVEDVPTPEGVEARSVLSPTSLNPLILSDNLIRYNHRLRVSYRTPIIFGSRSRAPQAGLKGYRPTHFFFDPVGGSLTTGTDVDLGWDKLGANSLVTGLGNQATAPASLVSGTYNKIFDLNKSRVGGSAILGGVRNTLQFSYQVEDGRSGSTIIGSSGVFALNCSNSVFLGLRLAPGVAPFDGLDNTTVVQDLQTLGEARMGGDIRANGSVYCADIYALGAPSQGQTKTTADIGGTIYAKTLDVEDAQVTGDIFTTNIFAGIPTQQRLQAKASGGLFGQTLDVKEAKAEIAVYGGDIYAVGITPASNSSKLEGSSKPEGGFYGKTLNVEVATIGSNVTPTPVLIDSNLVIEGGNPGTYDVAPLNQNVTILLDSTQAGFVNGQTISFKDITQVFQPTTPFNVLISVNNDVYIETYDAIGQLQLVQNGTYTLNTTGGAVTLRYVAAPILGAKSSWVITNQFSGRDRQPI